MANDFCRWSKTTNINIAAFPGTINSDPENVNMYEKMLQDGNPDAQTKNQQIISYINEKGYPLLYYPYLYEIDKAEKTSGEHSGAGYGKPVKIYGTFDLKDAPSFITAYGFDSQTTFTCFIHIETWKETIRKICLDPSDERFRQYRKIYNPNFEEEQDTIHAIEPHPKDLIQLMTFGCDRETGRGNRIFEVTNVEDEIISENFNDFFGHYTWKLTGVRYRYSFEDGMSTLDVNPSNNGFYLGEMGERGNHQVYDTKTVAKMFIGKDEIITEDSAPLVDTFIEDEESPRSTGDVRIAGEQDGSTKIIYYPKLDIHDDIGEKDSKNEYNMEKNVKNVYMNQAKHVISDGYL